MEGTIRSRGYLPHWDVPGACQFLTWRLHDALDPEEWQAWRETYRNPEEKAILALWPKDGLTKDEVPPT